MKYVFRDKIKNFIRQDVDKLTECFKKNFGKNYGSSPGKEQEMAWESSIRYLQNALDDKSIYDLDLVFEYELPLSNERIDLMIFGKDKSGKPKILLLELKGWRKVKKQVQILSSIVILGKRFIPSIRSRTISER